MSVSQTSFATDYAGATGGVPLACQFPASSASEIFLATLDTIGGTDFVNVDPADYVVTDLGAGNFELTPALTYPGTTTVRCFRWLSYSQPYDFDENGPLPAERIGAMGDRLCELIQQVRGELGLDVAAVTLPPGSTFVRATAAFANTTARGNATPFMDQIGVQHDTGNLYRGTTIAAGGWTLIPTGSSTANVAHGGTGLSVLTTYALLAGGTTGTGDIQQVSSAGAVPGYVLTFVSAAALPTWQAAGNVTAAAVFGTDSRLLLSDGTGKGVKAAQGINAATAASLDLGSVTDTTPRPLTISQTWNNAALTASGMVVAITDTNSTATSTVIKFTVGGLTIARLIKDGTWISNNVAASTTGYISWDSRTNLRAPADGKLTISNNGESQGFRINCNIGNANEADAMELQTFAGAAGGRLIAGLVATQGAAPTLVIGSNTITPTTPVAFVGAGLIKTITRPALFVARGGSIRILPTAAFTWDVTDNIAVAGTAVINRSLDFTWDPTTTKWHPSYV